MKRVTTKASSGILLVVLANCAKEENNVVTLGPSQRPTPTAEIAELEIRAVGVDRFVACPPPGDLGQPWFPEPGPWTPPARVAGDGGQPVEVDQDYITRTQKFTPTEQAIETTRRDFRSCYRRGLVHDPTQDGRVALALRIAGDGRVARVEEYAACEIATESIACMKDVAARLRFPPPPSGSDTVVIPAVFTSRDGVRRATGTPNDSYTARAYVTLESARPGLHACEQNARRSLRPIHAAGTFTLALDATGRVSRAHVDPWRGEQSTLACAAQELEKLRFEPPPSGRGTVIARLNFNPSQDAR